MSNNLKEQLLWLKSNTIRTGAIHDAQAFQLKMYPMMLPDVTTAEARVDVERKTVAFVAESSGLRPTKKFRQICEAIETWTRTILWDDTFVTIEVNGKKVYESKSE